MKLRVGMLLLLVWCESINFLNGGDLQQKSYSHWSRQDFTGEMILDEVSFKNATLEEVVRVLNVKLKNDKRFSFYRCAYVPDEETSKIRITFKGKNLSLDFFIDYVLIWKTGYFYSKENQTLVFGYRVPNAE